MKPVYLASHSILLGVRSAHRIAHAGARLRQLRPAVLRRFCDLATIAALHVSDAFSVRYFDSDWFS